MWKLNSHQWEWKTCPQKGKQIPGFIKSTGFFFLVNPIASNNLSGSRDYHSNRNKVHVLCKCKTHQLEMNLHIKPMFKKSFWNVNTFFSYCRKCSLKWCNTSLFQTGCSLLGTLKTDKSRVCWENKAKALRNMVLLFRVQLWSGTLMSFLHSLQGFLTSLKILFFMKSWQSWDQGRKLVLKLISHYSIIGKKCVAADSGPSLVPTDKNNCHL